MNRKSTFYHNNKLIMVLKMSTLKIWKMNDLFGLVWQKMKSEGVTLFSFWKCWGAFSKQHFLGFWGNKIKNTTEQISEKTNTLFSCSQQDIVRLNQGDQVWLLCISVRWCLQIHTLFLRPLGLYSFHSNKLLHSCAPIQHTDIRPHHHLNALLSQAV